MTNLFGNPRLEIIMEMGAEPSGGNVDIYWEIVGANKRGYFAETEKDFAGFMNRFLEPTLPMFESVTNCPSLPVHFDLNRLKAEYRAEMDKNITELARSGRAVYLRQHVNDFD
jgi:hypothetical protein